MLLIVQLVVPRVVFLVLSLVVFVLLILNSTTINFPVRPTILTIVQASGLSEKELVLELIILLFQRKKISVGKASQLPKMPLLQFQNELAIRNINIHYDETDLDVDLKKIWALSKIFIISLMLEN